MGLMTGKKGVIFGVANDRSIAWGIARKLHEEGAALAFTYLNEVFEKRVRPLAESIDADLILRCDVSKDSEIEEVFTEIEQKWGTPGFRRAFRCICGQGGAETGLSPDHP